MRYPKAVPSTSLDLQHDISYISPHISFYLSSYIHICPSTYPLISFYLTLDLPLFILRSPSTYP
jgi:hypothetical protein